MAPGWDGERRWRAPKGALSARGAAERWRARAQRGGLDSCLDYPSAMAPGLSFLKGEPLWLGTSKQAGSTAIRQARGLRYEGWRFAAGEKSALATPGHRPPAASWRLPPSKAAARKASQPHSRRSAPCSNPRISHVFRHPSGVVTLFFVFPGFRFAPPPANIR